MYKLVMFRLILLRILISALLMAVVLSSGAFRVGDVLAATAEEFTAGFFTGSDGVPVMPGMEEMPEMGMVFDKPEGRIVEGFASGLVNEKEIREFYGRTLPQLGWNVFEEGLFQREGEILSIEIIKGVENGRSILRIILAPSQ
ncbi:hypothetical protein O4H49_09350 [Kiloniella laminariae]|uniref:Uncharacterized protein n=1 Tax=Kiloniella laminariae TaxID=454162 RepID=A0ABT4LKT6_9PROT|nr:hypothetical protein [Kiloniella laminariae]MCZ4280981.1 hypothetical protein [Kiloniella laminariae]